MSEGITSFVGLDVHQDSIAVGLAPEGREEPRFIGTVAPHFAALSKCGHLARALMMRVCPLRATQLLTKLSQFFIDPFALGF